MRATKRGKNTRGESFLATIYRIWMLRYVDVPQDIISVLAKQMKAKAPTARAKYIPVLASVNQKSVRTTLTPAGGGRYRMQFNTVLCKAASADVGDVVHLFLALDTSSRDISVPKDLQVALKQHPKASKAFRAAPAGYRRQILKWMDAAKSDAARGRRIEVVIDRMLERALLRPETKQKE